MIVRAHMKPHTIALGFAFAALAACGPATRERGNGSDGEDDDDALMVDAGDPSQCVPQAEICGNGYDDDCDNTVDCEDNECSGVGSCPICGEVDTPIGTPLLLPDGTSSGTTCSTDAQCGGSTPNCVFRECHGSYTSTLNFIGFADGATLDDTSKFLNVCVTMEHSWLRDLQIELIPPSGAIIVLHEFAGRNGGEVYLGNANDDDSAASPVPGQGMKYCWTAQAPATMLQAASGQILPAGDYKPFTPFAAMQGTVLNGDWEFRVTDLWGADNGYVFEWSIAFDSSLVSDCSGPIVGRTTHAGGTPVPSN